MTVLPDLNVLPNVHPSRAGNSSYPPSSPRGSVGKATAARNSVLGTLTLDRRVAALAVP